MKVHVFYSAEPDSSYYTAYLDDEPDSLGVFKGQMKHGACEDMTAAWSETRQRFEQLWREPFDLARYL